jgi:hypothetical protein
VPRLLAAVIAVALALSLAEAAPVPNGEDKPVLYFPTKVGAKWVYSVVGVGEETEVINAVTAKDGVTVVTVDELDAKGVARLSHKEIVSGSGLVRCAERGIRIPPYYLLKLPCLPGETWGTAFKVNQGDWHRLTTLGSEVVTVPAGTYKAIRVEEEYKHGETVSRWEHWYVQDVGLVRTVATLPKGYERVLKSFTPGKD